jgi:hypothetical protein
MLTTTRKPRRRTLLATMVAPLLLGSVSAGAPLPRDVDADILYYAEQFYTDATYSVKVGAANAFCDGDYIWHWGYPTGYSKIVYRHQCP